MNIIEQYNEAKKALKGRGIWNADATLPAQVSALADEVSSLRAQTKPSLHSATISSIGQLLIDEGLLDQQVGNVHDAVVDLVRNYKNAGVLTSTSEDVNFTRYQKAFNELVDMLIATGCEATDLQTPKQMVRKIGELISNDEKQTKQFEKITQALSDAGFTPDNMSPKSIRKEVQTVAKRINELSLHAGTINYFAKRLQEASAVKLEIGSDGDVRRELDNALTEAQKNAYQLQQIAGKATADAQTIVDLRDQLKRKTRTPLFDVEHRCFVHVLTGCELCYLGCLPAVVVDVKWFEDLGSFCYRVQLDDASISTAIWFPESALERERPKTFEKGEPVSFDIDGTRKFGTIQRAAFTKGASVLYAVSLGEIDVTLSEDLLRSELPSWTIYRRDGSTARVAVVRATDNVAAAKKGALLWSKAGFALTTDEVIAVPTPTDKPQDIEGKPEGSKKDDLSLVMKALEQVSTVATPYGRARAVVEMYFAAVEKEHVTFTTLKKLDHTIEKALGYLNQAVPVDYAGPRTLEGMSSYLQHHLMETRSVLLNVVDDVNVFRQAKKAVDRVLGAEEELKRTLALNFFPKEVSFDVMSEQRLAAAEYTIGTMKDILSDITPEDNLIEAAESVVKAYKFFKRTAEQLGDQISNGPVDRFTKGEQVLVDMNGAKNVRVTVVGKEGALYELRDANGVQLFRLEADIREAVIKPTVKESFRKLIDAINDANRLGRLPSSVVGPALSAYTKAQDEKAKEEKYFEDSLNLFAELPSLDDFAKMQKAKYGGYVGPIDEDRLKEITDKVMKDVFSSETKSTEPVSSTEVKIDKGSLTPFLRKMLITAAAKYKKGDKALFGAMLVPCDITADAIKGPRGLRYQIEYDSTIAGQKVQVNFADETDLSPIQPFSAPSANVRNDLGSLVVPNPFVQPAPSLVGKKPYSVGDLVWVDNRKAGTVDYAEYSEAVGCWFFGVAIFEPRSHTGLIKAERLSKRSA